MVPFFHQKQSCKAARFLGFNGSFYCVRMFQWVCGMFSKNFIPHKCSFWLLFMLLLLSMMMMIAIIIIIVIIIIVIDLRTKASLGPVSCCQINVLNNFLQSMNFYNKKWLLSGSSRCLMT